MPIDDTYSFENIQNSITNGNLSLPTVQRGFVWKPYQIENLWDSLLRGYPIGAIVLSCKSEPGEFEILDGQQRLTAIGIAIQNPNDENNVLRSSQKTIRVFIDLEKPDEHDNRKYFFRVITKAHPWGYQKKDNQKPLESKNKRAFLEDLGIKDSPLGKDIKIFSPFDAYFPIPFEIFMNSDSLEIAKNEIEKWQAGHSNRSKGILTGDERHYGIEEIFQAVQEMKKNTRVPVL